MSKRWEIICKSRCFLVNYLIRSPINAYICPASLSFDFEIIFLSWIRFSRLKKYSFHLHNFKAHIISVWSFLNRSKRAAYYLFDLGSSYLSFITISRRAFSNSNSGLSFLSAFSYSYAAYLYAFFYFSWFTFRFWFN